MPRRNMRDQGDADESISGGTDFYGDPVSVPEDPEGAMKKRSFILVLFMLLLCSTSPAFGAERVRPIPNVRLSIQTNDLTVGDYLASDASSYVSVSADNQYYYLESADWMDYTEMLRVGDEPRIKVYVNALPKETYTSHTITTYLFRGSYNSSNVHITNGEFISAAVRDSGYTLEITLRMKPVKGTYDAPIEAYWSSSRGTAIWDGGDNSSGYYDVTCYRGSSSVKKLTNYKGTMYNFFPYMTKEGDYTFRVRSVASPDIGTSVGKKSEWTESNILTIGSDQVSDGMGQTTTDENGGSYVSGNAGSGGNTASVGGIQSGGYWYFRYPNGQMVTNGMMTINGKDYMFDSSGKMVTGWARDSRGVLFYFDPQSGAKRIGWLHLDNKWYFLNDTPDDFEGCQIANMWWNNKGNTYYFDQDGVMVTGWYQIDGKFYYFYPEGTTGGAYGYLARNTVIDGVFHVGADGAWIQG